MGYEPCATSDPSGAHTQQPTNSIYPNPYPYGIHQQNPNAPGVAVNVNVTTAQPSRHMSSGQWKQTLCCDSLTCTSDCCLALVCPHFYAACLANDVTGSVLSAICNFIFFPACLCCLRSKTRSKHGIEGNCCYDICATQCCACCAMIQMKEQHRS